MNKDIELFKFTRLYLGQTNWEFVKKTSKEELALFQEVPININKSYIVIGNQEILSKFKAFYLTRCLKKRPIYAQYSIYDYVKEIAFGNNNNNKDDGGLNVDLDLVFLYCHEHKSSLGKTDTWYIETILNKIADRNRDGLVSIILTERRIPILEQSGELELINLSGKILNKNASKAIQAVSSFSVNNGSY